MLRSAERVFIAYSHADLKLATRIHRKLTKLRPDAPKETVFLDQESLSPGELVNSDSVEQRLKDSDLIVVVCGSDTASRGIVQEEVRIALALVKQGRSQILPIILKSGVTLPDGIDYEIQGIFLTVLFPEIRWQRISAMGAATFLVVAVLGILARSAWAVWVAPEERWTTIDLPVSGFSEAVLVEPRPGDEYVRAFRTSIERGVFAEDVDNTNHLFLEFDISGEMIGAFATTRDDAGTFRDDEEARQYGGPGSLAEATAEYEGELAPAATIWADLSSRASQCSLVDYGGGLDRVFEIVDEMGRRLRDEHVKAFHCEKDVIIAVIPGEGFSGGIVLLLEEYELRHSTPVSFDPGGLQAIANRHGTADSMLVAKLDTRWEDEGSEGGLLASGDRGETWARLSLGEGADDYILTDVTAGLGRSQRIAVSYAAGEGGNYGVMVSDDDGKSWQALRKGLSGNTPEAIRLVGVAADDSVFVMLPGGRLARWRELSFAEKFIGMGEIPL